MSPQSPASFIAPCVWCPNIERQKALVRRRKNPKKIAVNVPEPKATTSLNLVCLADVEEEVTTWLWQPYIPQGKITILEGDPDSGKSFLSLALAAHVTTGRQIPFDKDRTGSKLPRNVLMLVGEDGAADTIKPRFRKVAGEMRRLTLLEGLVTRKDGEDDVYSSITLDNIPRLEEALQKLRPALVVIDPFQCFLGAKVDMYRANETRPILSALAKLAERYDCAFVLIRHLKKMDSKTIYRGIGAIDILAAARSVLLAGRNPKAALLADVIRTDASGAILEPKDRFAIVQTKCNLGKKGPSLEYSIDDTGLTIDGVSEITDDELLNSTMKTVQQDVDEWLEDLLSSGPVEANTAKAAAAAKGFGRCKLNGAVKRLGIKRKPTGFGGSWEWDLPHRDEGVVASAPGTPDQAGELISSPACADSPEEDTQ